MPKTTENLSTTPSGTSSDSKTDDLVPITVVETKGQSALVEYEQNGLRYRSYVDPEDIEDGQCPLSRIQNAPYGIDWQAELDLTDLPAKVHQALTARGIWTLDDLKRQDKAVTRIATNTLGAAIWRAAK